MGQEIYMSTYTGIDDTGATNSLPAFLNLQASVASSLASGVGQTIVNDCQTLLDIGTSSANPIFWPPNTNMRGTKDGALIVTNVGVPAFVMASNCTNVLFDSVNFLYNANFGMLGINSNVGPVSTQPGLFHNGGMSSYLVNNCGNTFGSMGTTIWSGAEAYIALINIRGQANNIKFRGCNFSAPQNVTANYFIPQVVGFNPDWNQGVTGITNMTPITSSNSSVPSNITFENCTFDGFLMGGVNSGVIEFKGCRFLRYSDLQDGTSGTVTFSSAFTGGESSKTLAANWAYPTGQYFVTLSNGQCIGMNLTHGATTATNFVVGVPASGLTPGKPSTVAGTATAVGASGNMGGVLTALPSANGAPWTAPPHCVYIGGNGTNTYKLNLHDCVDYGPYVGLPTRRARSSGSMASFKVDCNYKTIVENCHSYRPDGTFDLESKISIPTGGAVISNCSGIYDSSTLTADGIPIFGVRFAGPDAYINLTIQNLVMTDVNPAPVQLPIGANGSANLGCSLTGLKMYVQDWGSSNHPTLAFAGSNIEVEQSTFFNSFSSNSTLIGPLIQPGSSVNFDSTYLIKLYGWRLIPVTFTAPLSSATSGTIPAWTYPSGVYQINFSNNDVRFAAITNSSMSQVVTWTGAITASASATAQGSYLNAFSSLRPRIVLQPQKGGSNTRVQIIDATNGYECISGNALLTESWTQTQACTPLANTSSFTTNIVTHTTMGIDQMGAYLSAAFGTTYGMTGFTVGWSGESTPLFTSTSVATFNPATSIYNVLKDTGGIARTLVITPVGGNFDGTGTLQIGVRGTQLSMSS